MFEAAKSKENAEMQGSESQRGVFRAIKHLHFWLSAASLAMLFNSALVFWGFVAGIMIYGVIPDFDIPLSSPAVWYGAMFAFVASRIGISFAQASALSFYQLPQGGCLNGVTCFLQHPPSSRIAQIACFRRSCAPHPLKYLYRFASRCFGDIAILIFWQNTVRIEPLAPQSPEPQIFSIDDELLEQARRLEAAWLSEMR